MADRPRIIFFGTPEFSVPSLEALVQTGLDIVGVYTQTDKHAGRKRELSHSSVKQYALSQKLHILQPKSLRNEESTFSEFSALAPDLCVVVAYGKLIPQRFLDVPRLGFLNVHPSLLPLWRGPSPIQASIRAGDEKTGVSIMGLDADMDHGPIFIQHEVPLDGTEYAPELSERLSRIGAELLVDVVTKHLLDAIQPYEQNHDAATFCKLVSRDDARINWKESAVNTERLIRAYAGEPTAWTTWHDETINIIRAKAHKHQEPQTKPGTVLGFDDTVLVNTPDGTLELELIQPAGKKPMSAQAFANGHPDFIGSRLS